MASAVMPAFSADEPSTAFDEGSRILEGPDIYEEDGRFEVRSIGADGNRIRTEFRAREGELRLDFTQPDNTTAEVQLTLIFEALVEFVDEDGDGFDFGEEVQTFEIDQMAFDGPSVVELPTGGYQISVSYPLPQSESRLGIVFWVFENVTKLNETAVNPTEVKFDVTLSFFPFVAQESVVALMVKLKTELEPRLNLTESLAELEAAGERYQGFFKWSKSALVDGQPTEVTATVLKSEIEFEAQEIGFERTVFLAYERGQQIVHDPFVGVSLVPEAPPPPEGPPDLGEVVANLDILAYLGMVGAGVLFVLLTVLARRRRG